MGFRLSSASFGNGGFRLLKHLLMTVLLVVVATCAAQGAVIYSFAGTGDAFDAFPQEPVAFQLTVANFVAPPTNGFTFFSCAQFDSSTNCGIASGAFAISFGNFPNSGLGAGNGIGFIATNDVEYAFDFINGAFGTPGFYNALQGNTGTLTVVETPEPVTVLLALGGACLCALRRLLTKRSPGV